MSAIQAVHVRGHEERSEPKPHTVYNIEIQASVRSWHMWRRYSEFDELNTELTKSTGSAPPCSLPPKHAFSITLRRSFKDEKLLEERTKGLEAYLRAIVGSKEDKWREAFVFKEFLGVPVGKQGGVEGGAPSEFTSSSWLDEHTDLQSRVRDIRADINRRDALSDRGDVSAAHSSNVQAKKKLAAVFNRVGTLAKGLSSLAMAGMREGEVQRRSDMVARLQDDCEKLHKMVSVATHSSRNVRLTALANHVPPSEANRAALFDSPSAQKPFARVFGSAQPKETEQTRPLDDHGLLQLQQAQIEQQDAQASQLTAILQRQRQLGVAIGQEVSEQIDMLDDLNNDVDRVGGKLASAKKQLNRLDHS